MGLSWPIASGVKEMVVAGLETITSALCTRRSGLGAR
jgi:hypothetical protein